MRRKDGPAIRDTIIWIAAFVVSGGLGYLPGAPGGRCPSSSSTACSTAPRRDCRWHECGHGTAFKTRWMNDVVYHVACFMILREPTVWRWSHTRHHTDTIIVGRDPEIAVPRPPDIVGLLLNIFALKTGYTLIKTLCAARDRPAHRRGGDLRPRDGALEGLSRSPASISRSSPR